MLIICVLDFSGYVYGKITTIVILHQSLRSIYPVQFGGGGVFEPTLLSL